MSTGQRRAQAVTVGTNMRKPLMHDLTLRTWTDTGSFVSLRHLLAHAMLEVPASEVWMSRTSGGNLEAYTRGTQRTLVGSKDDLAEEALRP